MSAAARGSKVGRDRYVVTQGRGYNLLRLLSRMALAVLLVAFPGGQLLGRNGVRCAPTQTLKPFDSVTVNNLYVEMRKPTKAPRFQV